MTMVAAFQQDDAAYLCADTAIVDVATGNVLSLNSKIMGEQHFFAWAVAPSFVGPPQALAALAALEATETPQQLAERLPEAVAKFKREAAALGWPNPAMRLVAACYDRLRGPRIFIAGDGLEAWKPSTYLPAGVFEASYFFGAEIEDIADLWGRKTPNDPANFHPVHGVIEAYELRRRTAYAPTDGALPLGCYVGGELHIAQIGRDGMLGTIHRRWPDEIGKALDPGRCGINPLADTPGGS